MLMLALKLHFLLFYNLKKVIDKCLLTQSFEQVRQEFMAVLLLVVVKAGKETTKHLKKGFLFLN